MSHKHLLFDSDAREKLVRLALENAVSVAGVLLLTETTLTDVPEPKSEARPGAEAVM
jgi:chaperonin GroEL